MEERYRFRVYGGRSKPRKQDLMAEAAAHLEFVTACVGELAVGRDGMPNFVKRAGLKPAEQSELGFCVSALYEYAFNARWYRDWDLDVAFGKVYSIREMSATLDEFGDFDIVVDFPSTNDLGWLVDLAGIRAKLDFGLSPDDDTFRITFHDEELNVDDLAVLSGLALGSVRNATSATGEGRLTTIRRGKGAFVEPEEARRWLRTRPGFTETELLPRAQMLEFVTEGGALKMSESPEWKAGHLTRERLGWNETIRKIRNRGGK